MVFTGGAALAKYGSKIPALAKLATSLKKVDKVIPDETAEKLRKVEKTMDKVDETVVPTVVKTKKSYIKLNKAIIVGLERSKRKLNHLGKQYMKDQ